MKKIAAYSLSCKTPTLTQLIIDTGYIEKESIALRSGLNPAYTVKTHPASGISSSTISKLADTRLVYLISSTSSRNSKTFSLKDSVIFCTAFSFGIENFINDQTNLVLPK